MVRLGAIDSLPKTPCILGFECAGEVEAVGEGVEDFSVSIFFSIFISKLPAVVPHLLCTFESTNDDQMLPY